MITADLSRTALALSPDERLELARRLVESVVTPEEVVDAVEEGVTRIEDVAAGRVPGMTEAQYRAAVK